MNDAPSSERLNITTTNGARTTSLYTERKIKIFGISEPELDTISLLNTCSITFFSLASFILYIFIDNVKAPASEYYLWFLDPIGWVTAILYILGVVGLIQKKSVIKTIKNQSKII